MVMVNMNPKSELGFPTLGRFSIECCGAVRGAVGVTMADRAREGIDDVLLLLLLLLILVLVLVLASVV